MINKELVAEVLKSNMDGEAKAEVIDLVYLYRVDSTEPEKKARKKRTTKKSAEGEGSGPGPTE